MKWGNELRHLDKISHTVSSQYMFIIIVRVAQVHNPLFKALRTDGFRNGVFEVIWGMLELGQHSIIKHIISATKV